MVSVELFDIHDAARLREAFDVRVRVFVEEQGYALAEEFDGHDRVDESAVHALAREGGVALGTGRFSIAKPGTVRIARMAVVGEARGRGLGSLVLEALLEEAARLRFSRAVLLAQVRAREFYLRAGFQDDGCPLWDGPILHQPMAKTIEAEKGG